MRIQTPNDQGDIIEALRDSNYMYVWNRISKIGFKYFNDINIRYRIFCDCVENFDYEMNNNFIKYYSDRLKYSSSYNNDTFYVSNNRSVCRQLRNENISPTDCEKSKMIRELKNWSN